MHGLTVIQYVCVLTYHYQQVLASLGETMKKETSFGVPYLLENTLAEIVILVIPTIEVVRFVDSDIEACMSVLRLAHVFTGRQKSYKVRGLLPWPCRPVSCQNRQ